MLLLLICSCSAKKVNTDVVPIEPAETEESDYSSEISDIYEYIRNREYSLENDFNFMYSDVNKYDKNYHDEDSFEILYDDIIRCTYFVIDEKTNCIHYDMNCSESATASMSSAPVISFYEAIIFDYDYCKTCFAPITEYYSKQQP